MPGQKWNISTAWPYCVWVTMLKNGQELHRATVKLTVSRYLSCEVSHKIVFVILMKRTNSWQLHWRELLEWKTQILISHFLDIATVVFPYCGLLVLPPAARILLFAQHRIFQEQSASAHTHAFCSNVSLQIVIVLKYIFLSSSLLSMNGCDLAGVQYDPLYHPALDYCHK